MNDLQRWLVAGTTALMLATGCGGEGGANAVGSPDTTGAPDVDVGTSDAGSQDAPADAADRGADHEDADETQDALADGGENDRGADLDDAEEIPDALPDGGAATPLAARGLVFTAGGGRAQSADFTLQLSVASTPQAVMSNSRHRLQLGPWPPP